MITVGIDLAAQPEKTAACRLEWGNGGSAEVVIPDRRWDDKELGALCGQADAIGIDAPFGFPRLITRALSEYARTGRFPERGQDDSVEEWSQRLRFRETDL